MLRAEAMDASELKKKRKDVRGRRTNRRERTLENEARTGSCGGDDRNIERQACNVQLQLV